MKYGLHENTINEINSIFFKYKEIDEVILFGSRAKGNFRTGSDIDLAIKSDALSTNDLLKIQIDIDQIELIYRIDLVDYKKIKDQGLIEHIDRVGIVFFKRE